MTCKDDASDGGNDLLRSPTKQQQRKQPKSLASFITPTTQKRTLSMKNVFDTATTTTSPKSVGDEVVVESPQIIIPAILSPPTEPTTEKEEEAEEGKIDNSNTDSKSNGNNDVEHDYTTLSEVDRRGRWSIRNADNNNRGSSSNSSKNKDGNRRGKSRRKSRTTVGKKKDAHTQDEYIGFLTPNDDDNRDNVQEDDKKEEENNGNDDVVKHGFGITRYTDGRVFEGRYEHGIMVEGKMTYKDTSTYIGKFDQYGLRYGRGIYTSTITTTIIQQQRHQRQQSLSLDAKRNTTSSDDDDDDSGISTITYCGNFYKNEMHGSGVLYSNDGSKFDGRWQKGLRHGPGKEFAHDGTVRRDGIWNKGTFCLITAKINKEVC